MTDHLHIVCLDAPSPPDYGGAIDMHYKIKALAQAGKKISLHYFAYKKGRNAAGLENDCIEINGYPRKHILPSFFIPGPYIITSRINEQLIARLNSDDHPILLEGLHCAGIIPFINNRQRVVLRMHNEESFYYKHLEKTEHNFLKKTYFRRESAQLEHYQHSMDKELSLACLATTDMEVLKEKFRFENIHFIPCFIPWQEVAIQPGKGSYCLYHGNLSVSENTEAALWLIENVFSKTSIPLIIAGKGISKQLQQEAKNYGHVKLVADPGMEEINALIANAHINILPSMNATGVKLKLLHALLRGRFCITNTAGVAGSNVSAALHLASKSEEFISLAEELMKQEFTSSQIEERKQILHLYNNKANAEKLIAIW